MTAKELLSSWLTARLNSEEKKWVYDQEDKLVDRPSENQIHIAFSSAIRYSKKVPLNLEAADLEMATRAVLDWDPGHWTRDEALRAYILLCIPIENRDNFFARIQTLYQTGDVRECAAVLKTLPLLPFPQTYLDIAREGARSNMKASYEAIAHYNPYPKTYFNEGAWNQLVLKALFIESPLYPIQGLEEKNNKNLMRMLVDYAHERWAASRSISPELWRCVGPLATETELEDLRRAYQSENLADQRGAGLALTSCSLPEAQKILSGNPNIVREIKESRLTWNNVLS